MGRLQRRDPSASLAVQMLGLSNSKFPEFVSKLIQIIPNFRILPNSKFALKFGNLEEHGGGFKFQISRKF